MRFLIALLCVAGCSFLSGCQDYVDWWGESEDDASIRRHRSVEPSLMGTGDEEAVSQVRDVSGWPMG